jgi:hypothetical protein
VLDDAPCTNNNLEGWHNGLNWLLDHKSHPTLWKFIESLWAENAKNEFVLTQISSKKLEPKHRDIYKRTAARLKEVVSTYQAGMPKKTISYLNSIACNIQID